MDDYNKINMILLACMPSIQMWQVNFHTIPFNQSTADITITIYLFQSTTGCTFLPFQSTSFYCLLLPFKPIWLLFSYHLSILRSADISAGPVRRLHSSSRLVHLLPFLQEMIPANFYFNWTGFSVTPVIDLGVFFAIC